MGYASYSIVAVIASIEPAVASLLGVLVMKEQMDVFGAAGVGMIFAAIVVLNRKKQDKAPPLPPPNAPSPGIFYQTCKKNRSLQSLFFSLLIP